MSQYQSFPGAPGHSKTLDKVKALRLPDLAGRSFLDLGCNEGFFCGFARHLGADRVVGVDHSAQFVERAKQRFPDCEFLRQSWDTLPDGRFDVILLASALHYAADQEALLHRLVDKLTDDGTLVLELGIVSSSSSEWVEVDRGMDKRLFPTMPKLREILADHAWKWMGPSVRQDGDPVARHVLHVSRRRPTAYLLMEPPGHGKSSIARRLFGRARIPVVSGDQTLGQVAQGKRPAPEHLRARIADGYSPYRIDQTLLRLFEEGLGGDLVELWRQQAGAGDFALDVFVPEAFHGVVESALVAAGYLPVKLNWNRVGPRLLTGAELETQADAFYLSMIDPDAAAAAARVSPAGFVDELTLSGGRLTLRGWAVTEEGRLPAELAVRIGDRTLALKSFERQLRVDVQQHLGLPHGLLGFRATIDVPPELGFDDVAAAFRCGPGDDGRMLEPAFQLSEQLARRLAR